MLEIKNLHAKVGEKEILKGIDLTIRDGEIHALMGTNGAGKSTLSNVIVGNPNYEVTEGSITFNGQDLLAMNTEERAHAGIFMSFQAPIEIPGVSMTNFMRAAVNARREALGKEPLKSTDFLKVMREKKPLLSKMQSPQLDVTSTLLENGIGKLMISHMKILLSYHQLH